MQLIEAFVQNPVKVAVAVILVAMFGAIAVMTMPMQLVPEVQIPTLTVETRWLGASPQEVEREIIQEQEEQLQSVEGMTKMTSESMDSLGRITMEFEIGTDMSQALLLVNTRLSQVQEYPESADEPVISTSDASDRPIAWFVLSVRPPDAEDFRAFAARYPQLAPEVNRIATTANPGLAVYRLKQLALLHPEVKELLPADIDVTKERRFAQDVIEARFERVNGVSNSNVLGGREEELQVVVDPERLAARQLTIMDVRQALRGQNKDTSGGDFWEGKRRYVVRTLGQFRTPEQVAAVIIARRDGAPVYVRDVAEIRLGYKKPDGLVRRFGNSVINLNALRRNNANVLDVMAGLRKATAELNEGVLKQRGLQLTQVYDETEYIYSAMGLVNENVIEGAVLTLIVLLLFLRSMRSALVVFLAIAVSTVGMFLALSLMGRSLNVLSLAGIAFAVGMLVDNFIVVLENIYRHHSEGKSALAATIDGTKEVWGAVTASSLANLAVFIPVLFVRDEAGQLFRDIALAVSSALGFSLLVALVLVPTAASIIMRRGPGHDRGDPPSNGHAGLDGDGQLPSALAASPAAPRRGLNGALGRRLAELGQLALLVTGPLDRFGSWFVASVVGANAWLQRGLLRQATVALVMVAVSVFFSWLLLPKVEYLPNGNRNLILGILQPPPGYNLDQLAAIGQQIEDRLKPYWDVYPDSEEAKKLKYPIIADLFYIARGRQLFMGVRSLDPLRANELEKLIREMGQDIPGTILVAKQSSLFERGLTGGRTVDVEVTGPDIHKLVALGAQVLGKVQQIIPGAQAFPKPSLDLSSPEMHVTPKWQQAADMGVNATDLGYTVDALVDGAYASDYFIGGDKIDLSIVGNEQFVTRTQDLWGLSIATPNGELVPLAAVADVALASGPEQINHRERQRAITIEVSPPQEVALEEAMNRIRDQIVIPLQNSGQLEGLYQVNLSGTADKLRTTWRSLRWNLLLAFVITYLLMSALFESWLYPFIIILSVPLGAVGGFVGLWLLNLWVLQSLDVLTMLGFIILVGTVVNNPILIVEQALVHIREDGMRAQDAVLESVRTRIRPIFMTASIGLFGLLPLVVSPGAGSELYRGLGAVLLGGLVFSTVFTLIYVPTIFSLVFSLRDRYSVARRPAGDRRLKQPRALADHPVGVN
jgi:HAE1 family hydrophobic/amphiphilic exporter-1